MSLFAIDNRVETFEPNFEPTVAVGTIGTVTKVYDNLENGAVGYDVLVPTTEGTEEEFFFFEYELEAK